MVKKASLFALVALLLMSLAIPFQAHGAAPPATDHLVLIQKTSQMYHNGKYFKASQPLTEKKGVTYVAARSISERLYSKLYYDSKAQEYVISYLKQEIRYRTNSSSYKVNGEVTEMNGAPFIQSGTLMIPIRSLLKPYGITMQVKAAEKKIDWIWIVKPQADFTVSPQTIYAGETEVSYVDKAYHPGGKLIVDERWEGYATSFSTPGQYTVKRWVQDENGTWSDPYSVVIDVMKPNEPPAAKFVTDKASYKMGEPILYTDLSTDPENQIKKAEWTNNAKGFFVPGPQTVTLKVTDAHGATSEYSQTVTIENETLYAKQDFDKLFTDVGDKFQIDGGSVLQMSTIPWTFTVNGQQTLIRSNSPEHIEEEGIYYSDTASGNVRFLTHNQNNRVNPVRVYIVATNENAEEATVTEQHVGVGGPAPYVSQTGKAAVGNFLLSHSGVALNKVTAIPAGESRVILSKLSDVNLAQARVVTMYADVVTSAPIKFTVVVVDADKDVLAELPNLQQLPRDGKHVRGTFHDANRSVGIMEPIGATPSRIIITDKVVDTRLTGYDVTTGDLMSNDGNNGAYYSVTLYNVHPRTLIGINPRGGHYGGAFLVNNQLVYTTSSTILKDANDVGVLYRTGDRAETVTIAFTPASGSNLPFNILLYPLPALK
ncbi:copper amine oxidase N-terminal domain-containing protein [Paenibacillus sp. NEAU-GSW1]|uniref:copper amine oxidase N-terminal domain-containing protein n=1 Tax=Paenibacillus sp. NEAU-GSW1 TaxID=2682486 RepID=UPI0012E12934|nr:copper amine oxidase N-terminal domain-containing protein [Paenibacillus sp. NEAU-GSW1]MUT67058.1 copper amine oxidase N-terminal domain-containing protein [Paenibacillus sp. NEAU-GSW1]